MAAVFKAQVISADDKVHLIQFLTSSLLICLLSFVTSFLTFIFKAKIVAGETMAAHQKVRRFILAVHKLSSEDHTAGSRTYKVLPSVTCMLDVPQDPMLIKDEHGRLRVERPTTSQVKVALRPLPALKSTAAGHYEDLLFEIRKRPQTHDVLLVTDQGADYHPDHLLTQLMWYRLWRELGLGTFIHTHHAPGHSYLNLAERMMAILNILAGTFISDILPEDEVPPSDQPDLTSAERAQKDRLLFERIFQQIMDGLRHARAHNHPVEVRVVWPEVPLYLTSFFIHSFFRIPASSWNSRSS